MTRTRYNIGIITATKMDYSQESDKPEWTVPKCLKIKRETELLLKYSTVKWKPINTLFF